MPTLKETVKVSSVLLLLVMVAAGSAACTPKTCDESATELKRAYREVMHELYNTLPPGLTDSFSAFTKKLAKLAEKERKINERVEEFKLRCPEQGKTIENEFEVILATEKQNSPYYRFVDRQPT